MFLVKNIYLDIIVEIAKKNNYLSLNYDTV